MRDSIYKKNKKKLEKYYQDLLEKLDQKKNQIENQIENKNDDSHKVIFEEFENKSILQIEKENKKWRMNSYYEDRTALETWGKQFEKIPFNSVILFFGMASVSYVEKLLSITPKEVYIVLYEPSVKVFERMLEEVEIPFLESNRVGLIVEGLNDQHLRTLLGICVGLDNLPHIKYVCHPNYIQVFGKEYTHYMEIVKEHVERCVFNRNTQMIFNREMPKNYIGNLKTFYHHHSVGQLCEALPKDIPVIVVSAGPSLNKNIKDLKAARNKAFIIATDTAVKPLLKEDIVPHCFVTVDPGKPMLLFEDERVFDIPMVLTLSGNTDIVKRHRGKKFFSYDGNGYIRYFYEKGKRIPTVLSTGGSVANNAFSVGIEAGAKTIIFVGQDLAFTGNKTHADGTFQEKMDEMDMQERRMVEVESIDGGTVLTSLDFKHYLDWFENEIKTCPEVKFIDATEGGAKIHGTEIMTLKEAIAQECQQELNLDQIIDEIPKLFADKNIKEFDEYTDDAPLKLNFIEKKAEQGMKYYEKIVPYFEKNNLQSEDFKKLIKKIKKIDRDLEKEPLMHIVKAYMKADEYGVLYDVGIVKDDLSEEGKTISDKGIAIFKMMQEAVEYIRPYIDDMAKEKWGNS